MYIRNIPQWIGSTLVRTLEFRDDNELVAECTCLEWLSQGYPPARPDQFKCSCKMLKENEAIKKIVEELEAGKKSPLQILMESG